MKASTVVASLESALTGRRLLDHPFYKRWNAGELSSAELREYAEQYRHFEAELPNALNNVAEKLPEDRGAASVRANLSDELGPPSHLDMFDAFLAAAGGSTNVPASSAMERLVNAYRELSTESPAQGLAGIAAYEVQSSDIATTKGDGLRKNYGMNAEQTDFWTVHGELEMDHADWSIEGLAAACNEDDAKAITKSARRVADAWWGFLDERQMRSAELVDA